MMVTVMMVDAYDTCQELCYVPLVCPPDSSPSKGPVINPGGSIVIIIVTDSGSLSLT